MVVMVVQTGHVRDGGSKEEGICKGNGEGLSFWIFGKNNQVKPILTSSLTDLFISQNAFPVSGQLYTTHLLSLDALLTVIDSTEAHCQAKVLNTLTQQEKKETARPGYEAVDGTQETNSS